MAVYNPFDFFLEPDAEEFPFTYAPELKQELAPYLITEPATPLVQAYLDKIDRTKQRSVDLPGRSEPDGAQGHQLHHPHGAWRADARGDAGRWAPAPAATPAGCWCSCCATAAWRRASSRAT
jgi:hypothetical protein